MELENVVFYMLCLCKMCCVAFLFEEICIDELCCLVSLVGSGRNGMTGEVWTGCGKALGSQFKSISTLLIVFCVQDTVQ